MISEFFAAAKARVTASIQSVILLAVAAVAAIVAVGFLIAALHTWLAQQYGPIDASLAIGGAFLLIAIVIVIVAAIMRRQAARRLKVQQDRLLVQPATLATTLMSQVIGPKQTGVLMLLALAAGFLAARPRRSSRD